MRMFEIKAGEGMFQDDNALFHNARMDILTRHAAVVSEDQSQVQD